MSAETTNPAGSSAPGAAAGPSYDSRASAEAHVRRALELVEAAQHQLEEACRELSPVVGGVRQWSAVGALVDRVRSRWYALDSWLAKNRGRLDLDAGTAAAEAARADGGRP